MRRKIIIFILGVFWTTSVLAQFYKDKYEDVVVPMEKAVDHSREYTANVQMAGAAEDDKPAQQRYEENVGTMDKVTDKHFIVVVDGKIPDKAELKP